MQFDAEAIRKKVNLVQKQITQKKKAKEDADDLLKEKIALDKEFAEMWKRAADKEKEMNTKAATIGNIVDKDCYVSSTEVCTARLGWNERTHPKLIFAHHLNRTRTPSPSCGTLRVPTTREWTWSNAVSASLTSPPTSSRITKFWPDSTPLTLNEVPRSPVTEVSS